MKKRDKRRKRKKRLLVKRATETVETAAESTKAIEKR